MTSWKEQSLNSWKENFGKNASFDTKASAAGNIVNTASSIFNTASSLASPSQQGKYNALKNQAAALNNTVINSTSFDDIYGISNSWTPLKTDYSWKDFYANGGYLNGPLVRNYSAGGRMAAGIGSSTASGAMTGAQIGGPWGAVIGGAVGLLGSGLGAIFGHSKAKKMARRANSLAETANNGMQYKIGAAADNATQNQLWSFENSNPYAYGGLFDTSGDAIGYSLASDYINMKNKQVASKGSPNSYLGNNTPVFGYNGVFGNTFALGGDMQSNGADWSTGLTHVNAGGRHEANPNGGVQMGVAPDGKPDVVEQGETIRNNFVFSDRIYPTKDVLKLFNIKGKDGTITYADVSKKIEEEAKERPNDPISKAALNKQLDMLAEAQETQKAQEEQQRIQEAFARMSPEEQAAMVQYMQQQQMAATQEQSIQQQEAQPQEIQQPQMAPEDMQAMQETQVQASPQGIMAAYGGNIKHSFPDGGQQIRNSFFRRMGIVPTDERIDTYMRERLGPSYNFDWSTLGNYKDLSDADKENVKNTLMALSNGNKAMIDAVLEGYDYGNFVYNPSNYPTFSNSTRGGWESSKEGNGVKGWYYDQEGNIIPDENLDEAAKQTLDKVMETYTPLNKEGAIAQLEKLSRPEFEKLMSSTDAYQKTNAWLQASDDNRKAYLKEVATNGDQDAKDYVARFYDSSTGNWKQIDGHDVAHGFNDIFGDGTTGVRFTYPGNFWHTAKQALRDNNVKVKLLNPQTGNYELVDAQDVNKDWKLDDTYTWATPDSDNTIKYYSEAIESPKKEDTSEAPNIEKMPYKDERMRIAALAAPAIGNLMWTAGIGAPDYSGIDAAINNASMPPQRAEPSYIGDYLQYRPMDVWAATNKLYASKRATDRSILNNNSSVGAKMAGTIANGYDAMTSMGPLYAQALEYNNNHGLQIGQYNKDTNKYNSTAAMNTSQFNANAWNDFRNRYSSLALDAAKNKISTDSNWYNVLYGNTSDFFQNLADLGRENAQYNRVAGVVNSGAAGVWERNEDTDAIIGATQRNRRKGNKNG